MFKKLLNKKLLKNQKGLTLIELLAVIVILAIVAAIAIPAIGNIIENSRYNAVKADAINVLNAAHLYYTDTPDAASPVSVSTLKTNKYIETAGKIPDTATIENSNPKGLISGAIIFSGSGTGAKSVNFNGATITSINSYSKVKGSEVSGTQTITAALYTNN